MLFRSGAASGLVEEGFTRNFQACKDCFQGLLRAESFAQQNLNLKVGPLSFLVLPAFLREVGLNRADLEAWSQRLQVRVGVLADISRWVEKIGGHGGLESELLDFLEDLALPFDNAALLNFLFYRKSKSEFRVLALVKEIRPSWWTYALMAANILFFGFFSTNAWLSVFGIRLLK